MGVGCGDVGEMVVCRPKVFHDCLIPNKIYAYNICFHILSHDNGNSTGQLSVLRDMWKRSLLCVQRKKRFWRSGSLVLVPFLLIQLIKNPENNGVFSLQFVYQAWITDPKTALRQRRKEKKRSAREEQKRRRKGSGDGKWWMRQHPCFCDLEHKWGTAKDKLGRNEVLDF